MVIPMNNKQITKPFTLYLKSQRVSNITLRNYSSDINHFLDWFNSPLSDPYKIAQSITEEALKKYQQFLQENNIAISTTNRRFSALRQLGRFFIFQGWSKKNPVKKVGNITAKKENNFPQQLMEKFAKSLKNEGKNKTTIRNYVSDVKGYLEWSKINLKSQITSIQTNSNDQFTSTKQ